MIELVECCFGADRSRRRFLVVVFVLCCKMLIVVDYERSYKNEKIDRLWK